MNFWTILIDIIVLAIIGYTVYKAYKQGFLLTVYRIITVFLAIWIAWMINPIVKTTLIEHTSVKEYLDENITEGISRAISKSLFTGTSTEESENAIEGLNVPKFVKKYLEKESSEDKTQNALGLFISDKITDICLTIISFVIVIVLVTIILSLLKGIIQMIADIPIITQIDKILGIVFGVMLSCIKLWVIFLIIGLFIKASDTNIIYTTINGSLIGSWFYNNNLLSYIVLKILS